MENIVHTFKKNGINITLSDKTEEHLKAHPGILVYLEEVIEKLPDIDPVNKPSRIACEIDLQRIVGKSSVISLSKGCEVKCALRKGRLHPSPVTDIIPQDTSIISIVILLKINPDQGYSIASAWFGPLAPKEPTDPSIETEEEKNESIEFWQRHAFSYDKEIMSAIYPGLRWETVLIIAEHYNKNVLKPMWEKQKALQNENKTLTSRIQGIKEFAEKLEKE